MCHTFGMTSLTTIKVPREVRDRLASHARRDNVTLATALLRALDRSEELDFWEAVRAHHVTHPTSSDALAGVALRDHLEDDDDDRLGRDGW
jgi:cell wall assembly regulator SMI1